MSIIEKIKLIVQDVRRTKEDNIYVVDFAETFKQAEKKCKCKIILEKVNSTNLKLAQEFFNLSGKVEKQTNDSETTYIIKVNPFDYSLRQNFTKAHELGHILLKHNFPNDGNVLDDPTDNILARSENAFDRRSLEETQANQFAAELLMPEKLVRTYFSSDYIPSVEDIEKAAENFQVSTAAMMVRLDVLNYRF